MCRQSQNNVKISSKFVNKNESKTLILSHSFDLEIFIFLHVCAHEIDNGDTIASKKTKK
jgi:hypothetical protein